MDARDGRGRSRRALLLATILMFVGCSSIGDEPTASPKRASPSGGSTAPSANTTQSPSPGDEFPELTVARFETKSGNILCESFSSSLSCVIESGLVPEPSHEFCPVDWIGLFIQVDEFAGPSCSGDPGISRDQATVLEYGQTWVRDGVTCVADQTTGLACHDQTGNGFTLARAGWSLLGKEAAATSAFNGLRRQVRKEAERDLPGKIASVPRPYLREGGGCGGLQEAVVETQLTDGRLAVYTACYVSGAWNLSTGPLFPD